MDEVKGYGPAETWQWVWDLKNPENSVFGSCCHPAMKNLQSHLLDLSPHVTRLSFCRILRIHPAQIYADINILMFIILMRRNYCCHRWMWLAGRQRVHWLLGRCQHLWKTRILSGDKIVFDWRGIMVWNYGVPGLALGELCRCSQGGQPRRTPPFRAVCRSCLSWPLLLTKQWRTPSVWRVSRNILHFLYLVRTLSPCSHVWSCLGVAALVWFLWFGFALRICPWAQLTESQNGRGWKGPLWII